MTSLPGNVPRRVEMRKTQIRRVQRVVESQGNEVLVIDTELRILEQKSVDGIIGDLALNHSFSLTASRQASSDNAAPRVQSSKKLAILAVR